MSMRYKWVRSMLIVGKPSGDVVQRETLLYYDTQTDTFGIKLTGDSPLKGYSFDVLQREFKRARDSGELANELPGA